MIATMLIFMSSGWIGRCLGRIFVLVCQIRNMKFRRRMETFQIEFQSALNGQAEADQQQQPYTFTESH